MADRTNTESTVAFCGYYLILDIRDIRFNPVVKDAFEVDVFIVS
jgi:hypothetical protein